MAGGKARVLVLRLAGPWMSFGLNRRLTALRPTQGAVEGILAAALGGEGEKEPDFSPLRYRVLPLSEGVLGEDYVSALRVASIDGRTLYERAVAERYHLEDADFLVAVEGPLEVVERLAEALRAPRRRVGIGRRAFLPDRPLFVLLGEPGEPVESVLVRAKEKILEQEQALGGGKAWAAPSRAAQWRGEGESG